LIKPGDEILEVYLEETSERLNTIETGLLQLERRSAPDSELVNSIFRDAHSVKAGANLLKLKVIEELAHTLENVLENVRTGKIPVTEMIITASLEAVDKLRELVDNIDRNDDISIRLHTAMLEMSVKKSLER